MKLRFVLFSIILLSLFSYHTTIYASAKSRFDFERTGHAFWDVKTKEKMVALTFDDGPNPVYTPQILNVLAKYHAKATFFVIGAHVVKYPYLIEREIKEGHEIGNHTFQHSYNLNMNEKFLKSELNQTSDAVQSITGVRPALFRPVGGYYNDLIVNTAIKNHYQVVIWSWHQDTRDWSRPGADKIASNVLSTVAPGNIILMHDSGGDRQQTVQALEKILKVFAKEGYECVTVSEMLSRSKMIKSTPTPFQLFPYY
ncbi:polysaccharide deacetylase family protein [Bacillus ginsengihumi]|uniref:Chitooligosaccharide deacetylase n=1 Tax=Heyndrickxia ginsengihumi TaxID=363870 RepID=A0A0A6VCK5_9BACI|nr:polysaccharide deacetylase family protein [Heyndrickxia ginsengihumi]KHD84269.1 chitooligosaccharide deacetylase [Heyndrickxia ginsengihumi]MBE6183615.1 polysaccharide deacetylase family protein [Bacillus sp. (in: firmicutes)]NEY19527.1 polysaccharide deacetylase family protein [Heyndrickxia ginsengihumi]